MCFVAFLGDISKYEKNILLSSSRAFQLSTPTFLLSTPVDNSEATTWKKATKCNNYKFMIKFRNWIFSSARLVPIPGEFHKNSMVF